MYNITQLVEEIVEVLQTAPARFAIVYFNSKIIVKTNKTISIQIVTTFDNIQNSYLQKIYESKNKLENQKDNPLFKKLLDELNLGTFEKFHQTGLALGTLEYYFTSKNLNFSKTFHYLDNEVFTEYEISCPT